MRNKTGLYIVIFAIIMMVSAALISYFLVKKNEPQLMSLKMDVENKQFLIKNIWDDISKKENRADTLILIETFATKDNATAAEIKNRYLEDFPNIPTNASVIEILDAVDKEKSTSVENINNLYLEQITAQRKISNIEQSNKLYANLAFFLQGLGLLLIILKRDILAGRRA